METATSSSQPLSLGGALLVGAAAGACVGAAAAWIVLRPSSNRAAASGSHLVPSSACSTSSSTIQQHGQPASVKRFMQDEVLSEQLTRNVQFFGEQPQQKIADAFVVVVGLGGVGSHAAHMLLRSGVGKLRLVDFDQVTLSSLNRHAVATREDVGSSKAKCLEKHFLRMVPEADIESVVEMYTADNEEMLLGGNPDFVVDAIDNLDTKAHLIAACKRRGLRVLCSAGAGAKADPTRLKVVDMSEASIDPLARAVRHRLRMEYGVLGDVPVLLSTEKPRCKLVDVEGDNPLDFQIVPNFRVRTIPVLGTTPAIFGMAIAAYVLCQLAGAPFDGEPVARYASKEYERLLVGLRRSEEEKFGDACPQCPLDLDDVIYLVRELWRGFSARHMTRVLAPGGQKGLTRAVANLTLTRWDHSKPPSVDNVVLLTFDEASEHEQTSLAELKSTEPEFVAWVEQRLELVRRQHWY